MQVAITTIYSERWHLGTTDLAPIVSCAWQCLGAIARRAEVGLTPAQTIAVDRSKL